jgi:dCMP deaminase
MPRSKELIQYPYIPKGRSISYVPASNKFMQAAEQAAEKSLDYNVPTGSVIVKDLRVIGAGANGSVYHDTHPCVRVQLGIPTGQGYELCEGCHPKNHSEPRAISNAVSKGLDTKGADLYLWGHWWCCEPCWNAITAAGITNVYLMTGSEHLFNKSDPKNILKKA